MPSPSEILVGLTAIANEGIVMAIGWHVVLAGGVIGLAHDWRPSRRRARGLLAMPLVSSAVFAAAFGNPFTASLLGATALVLMMLATGSRDRANVAVAPTWIRTIGAALIAYGWVYPEFLEGSALEYFYAAPFGLIPCPTLAVSTGFALVGNGLGSRPWSLVLASVGLFYGVFGVMVLGVALDLGLVVGAAALATVALAHRSRHPAALGASWPS